MCREALMLSMKMKVKGFSLNRVTYKLLIRAQVRNSDYEKAALLRKKKSIMLVSLQLVY